MAPWHTRPETASDREQIHRVNAAAFPTTAEAELVDALRADPDAWIAGLSTVATDDDGKVVAHALLSRCRVGGRPALVLGPCAVLPEHQRTGAGAAAIRAGLEAARELGENLVTVLGHPDYYPRFGFVRASEWGIAPGFDVPDEAMRVLSLDPTRPVPTGVIEYPPAFGV
ncbi:N-acetyltransferase [Rhodococcus sp. D2-41]|uniref:GNAT family N-acetyltransferase n=1 Tax=Speluncibacter jeojiensis TaxID=2710754 RepID=UPI00240EADBC|nr:N-acetyltransferase [Rhodococcus sp. D2-41]MDG3012016.1 N-acetyltransferase [Rhodococcus sp. D2-41]